MQSETANPMLWWSNTEHPDQDANQEILLGRFSILDLSCLFACGKIAVLLTVNFLSLHS